MEKKTLILFPGLGGDERLLEPQRAAFPEMIVPVWPRPERRELLPAYARRWAGRLRSEGVIGDGERIILGGVSFGGMVALEMARHVPVEAVIMIGSCRSVAAIPGGFHAAYGIWRWLPRWAWRPNRATIPLIMGSLGATRDPQYRNFVASLRETPPEFLRWACGAILRWRPEALPDVRIVQVHGLGDRLIPLRRLNPPPDMVIEGGGHLINVSHAEDVNRVIGEVMGGDG